MKLREDIESGRISRLNRRANKKYAAGFETAEKAFDPLVSSLADSGLELYEIMYLVSLKTALPGRGCI